MQPPQGQRPGAGEPELVTEPAQPDRSLGELFGDMTRDFSSLVRKEIELAKTEIKEDASSAGKAGAMLGGAGVVALVAFIILSIALAEVLDEFMARWLAFTIVGLLLAAIAAVLATIGKQRLSAIDPTPKETVQTLKEDAQWLSEQRS